MRGRFAVRTAALTFAACFAAWPALAQSIQDLQQMSLDDLANLNIMSVTRTSKSLGDAPAAVYVITHDAIVRSGYASLPDILRLAPNLHVIQISASHFIITPRGLTGNISAQNFSNTLLVMIDGRSVYTPLFSGVYWDMQDVMPEDIERIEVVSGPGATLWGANAVNGVINIITRKAADTEGGLVSISAGNLEQSVSLRYGGKLAEDLAYRLYVRDYIGDDTALAGGGHAHDNWSKPQGGFRLDWTPSESDSLTVQGDAYQGSDAQQAVANEDTNGRNLQARWNHTFDGGSSLQVQAYYDRAGRRSVGEGGFAIDTYDLDVQHSFLVGDSHAVTWGGGVRVSHFEIDGTPTFFFTPPVRTITLANIFAQDSITLSPSLTAIVALKLEDDPYSGLAVLPTARLSWKAGPDTLVWGAVSRAIRSPTPFDDDVSEISGGLLFLSGNPNFQSTTVTAYELGVRTQLFSAVSLSVSGFYNSYDKLRSIEISPTPTFLPLIWGNGLAGETYGADIWADYQVTPWWRLSAAFDELIEHFAIKPGNVALLGIAELGDDPQQRASLRSSMNLGPAVTLDGELRYVSALPDPHLPAFVEFNTSIGWNVSDDVRLSLSGFNLLHARHLEFPASEANAVPRSFAVGLQWRF
jgi:iron complex outermembrane receptor protein